MQINPSTLSDQISQVCPIFGVSIAKIDDRSTWRIDFADTATPEQKSAAAALLAAFYPLAPVPDDVDAERNRRIATFVFDGKLYDLCNGRGSEINIAGAGTLALAAIISGAALGDLRWADQDTDFKWIAADNSTVTMDALTCLNFAKAAASWKERHIHAARTIKNMSPIPSDYQSDSRWPT